MAVDLIMGMFLGGALTFVGTILIGGVVWFVIFMSGMKLKYIIPITDYTGGQPTVSLYKAQKITDPIKGECYFIPKLKKSKQPYLPFLGSKYEYPLKGGKFFVNFVRYDNETTAMQFEPKGSEQRDIIISYDKMTDDEKKAMTQVEIEYLAKQKEHSKAFFRVNRTVQIDCIRPVKKNLRKWVIDNDRQIAHELPQLEGFWEKYGKDVMTFSFIAIIGGVCLFLIIFSYQHADKVLAQATQAPAWAQSFINVTQANISIPRLG